MKIGVTVKLDQPITAAAEQARRAEDLGFDGVWLADHYFLRDVSATLALMATATEHVTLGTAVMSPYLRHPTLLASLAQTLTEIAPGRFILGVGTGGYEFTSEMGIDIRRPLGAITETVQIARELATGTCEVSGNAFSAQGSALRWRSDPAPVYLAARGPKMLERAGQIADGVITHGIAPTHIDFVKERVDGGCKVALMLDVEINPDRDAALAALKPRCVTMAGGSYADQLIELYGLSVPAVQDLRTIVRTGDRAAAAAAMTDDMAEAFGLAGSAEQIAEGIDRLRDAGVDEVIISVGAGGPAPQLEQLAKAVLA